MTTPRRITITDQQLEELVNKAVDRAVKHAFAEVGLSIDGPEHQNEAYNDLRYLRAQRENPEFARNIAFIERLRRFTEGTAARIGYAIIATVLGTIVWLIGGGFNWWKGH